MSGMQFHYIANAARPSASGRTIPVIDPSDGQPFDELQRGNADDIDAAVSAARRCYEGVWSKLSAAERGPPADAPVEQGRRACRGTRGAGAARLRQAHQAGQGRCPGAGALLRVLCRRLRQAARRHHPLPGRLQRVHLARAARRHRAHHPVELPDADLRPQRRRRAGGRQRLRGQAFGRRLPVADPRGAAGGRGRLSGRRHQHRDRLRPRSGRRAGPAPGHRPHQLHRQPEGRHGDPAGGGRAPLPGHAGAGRQEPADHLRRRRPRRRPADGHQRHRPERRPDLLGRLAPAGGAVHLRAAARAAGQDVREPARRARPRWTSMSAR